MKFSRSHRETDTFCRLMRFLNYHFGGTGIVPTATPLPLALGSFVHGLLGDALIGHQVTDRLEKRTMEFHKDMGPAIHAMPPRSIKRELALGEGLVRAWAKIRMPRILDKFKVLSVELEEDTVLKEGAGSGWGEEIVFMQRKDGILSRKEDNAIVVLEFKTTRDKSPRYLDSWRYDSQALTHLLDCKEKYGEHGAFVLMEFLYKGYVNKDGEYCTPILRGYKRSKSAGLSEGWETEYGWNYANCRSKEWEIFDTWTEEFQGKPEWMTPIQYWVDHVLDFAALNQHLYTREVYQNESDLTDWVDRAAYREAEIAEGLHQLTQADEYSEEWLRVLMKFFPGIKNRNCFYSRGRSGCPFIPLCFKEIDLRESLMDGLFENRVSHHEGEFE
jgi:hypothetical protein